MGKVAALTMVREDLFFLRAWLRHYGGIFGRENCYVVNHGRGEDVAALAEGCNIIGLPGDPHPNFDMKRWRMLNNLVQGLRCYYDHVIVGDVDELLVMDPDQGTLGAFLEKTRGRRVLTPIGLEVIHRTDLEDAPIEDQILGPRRFVRPAPHYSKPCVISTGTKIARGGHFTQFDQLIVPEGLYLLHLKFCDFAEYSRAMDRRNLVARQAGGDPKQAAIGRHWFAQARGDDLALFQSFASYEMQEGFDLSPLKAHMEQTWAPRGDTGFYAFDRPDLPIQYQLPERFLGLV